VRTPNTLNRKEEEKRERLTIEVMKSNGNFYTGLGLPYYKLGKQA